jgi:hypothetical protein
MFIANFKQTLQNLPVEDDGYDALMQHMSNEEAVVAPTTAFLRRITDFAIAKVGLPPTPTYPCTRITLAAIAITRFPIETLTSPEEPLPFTLLTYATKLLITIDRVLHEHSASENDTEEDFLPLATAAQFLAALGEYHAAWADWFNHDVSVGNTKAEMARRRNMQDEGPTLIFGDMETNMAIRNTSYVP